VKNDLPELLISGEIDAVEIIDEFS
jgi:hypothetical protein